MGNLRKISVVVLMSLLLIACGGGGGGGNPPPQDPAFGNQWDQMEWDKGQWG
jgi:hypothetical protein